MADPNYVSDAEIEACCREICRLRDIDPDAPTYVGMPEQLPFNRYRPLGPAYPMWTTFRDIAYSALNVVKGQSNG